MKKYLFLPLVIFLIATETHVKGQASLPSYSGPTSVCRHGLQYVCLDSFSYQGIDLDTVSQFTVEIYGGFDSINCDSNRYWAGDNVSFVNCGGRYNPAFLLTVLANDVPGTYTFYLKYKYDIIFASGSGIPRIHGVTDCVPITIELIEIPFELANDTVVQVGTTLTYNAGSGYSSYFWSDGSIDSVITVQADSAMSIWVRVLEADSTGGLCSGSDTVHIDVYTGIQGIDKREWDYGIYPNPASEKVEIITDDVKEVSVYNVKGKLVLREKSREIYVGDLPKGLYIIMIEGVTKKFVKF